MDDLNDYDYELPPELIAAHPLPERDGARLMVVNREAREIAHRSVREIPAILRAGDLLVLNDTKVVPARLLGQRLATGGKWEGLFLAIADDGRWRLIAQTRGTLLPGETIIVHPVHDNAHGEGGSDERLQLTLETREEGGIWTAVPDCPDDPFTILERFGTVPLPPYLHRNLATEEDRERYQTIYARRAGAIAAPTAGLHFTSELLDRCRKRGIADACVTLHVGLGTFRPVAAQKLSEHRMHSEWCEVSAETVQRIESTRNSGGRIIAVGTTTVRALETAARSGVLQAWRGETDIFIRPPYEFQVVDGLLTNFHLPRSTLLALVCALVGKPLIDRAYRAAIAEQYRFYSYGDAMLLA